MFLSVVCLENEAEAIKLIEEGADANITDITGRMPMLWAVEYGKENKLH